MLSKSYSWLGDFDDDVFAEPDPRGCFLLRWSYLLAHINSCRRTPAADQWPIAPQIPRSGDGSSLLAGAVFCTTSLAAEMPDIEFGARKIFFMLFLMLGPIKILVPFVTITNNCDARFRRRIARRAILFSAAALAIAGCLGGACWRISRSHYPSWR